MLLAGAPYRRTHSGKIFSREKLKGLLSLRNPTCLTTALARQPEGCVLDRIHMENVKTAVADVF